MIKILITVEGGIVQQVFTNSADVQYVVVDFDDKSDYPVVVSNADQAELLNQQNIYSLYAPDNKEASVQDTFIYQQLKDQNF